MSDENRTGESSSAWRLTLALVAALALNFMLRLPTPRGADWALFCFYDPGSVIKADVLLDKGYVPTVDFGYTHGLLSLIYGRVGFALLGRTPWAFLALTALLELFMAWGLARLLRALDLRGWALGLFFAALPMAIMPAYLTLTHPLEATLLILALADHAEGKRGRALALLTACLFVKPSMAYLYGLVLTLPLLLHGGERRWRDFAPAAVTGVVLLVGLAMRFGLSPVIKTLLPLTGARAYADSGFGFFNESGREFWLLDSAINYLLTPTGIFLLAAAATLIGGAAVLVKNPSILFRSRPAPLPQKEPEIKAVRKEMLLTIAVLHTAFLLGFYGWTGSWTYYTYMPVLGMALIIAMIPTPKLRTRAAIAAVLLTIASHTQLVGHAGIDWSTKSRNAQTAGLWAYPEQLDEWNQTRALVGSSPTLVLTNGYIANLPPNMQMPDAWFPEPGIPTASEISRIKQQLGHAEYLVLWNEYNRFDVWNSPAFSENHDQFKAVWRGNRLAVLRRAP